MSGYALEGRWYASSFGHCGVHGWNVRDDDDELVAWLPGEKRDGPPMEQINALRELREGRQR